MNPHEAQSYELKQAPVAVSVIRADSYCCFSWFTCLCCNQLCGAFALAHSWDVEKANQHGHQATAFALSQRAKRCACASLVFGLFAFIPVIVLLVFIMTGVLKNNDLAFFKDFVNRSL